MTGIFDSFQRPINYLRVSVTDRCNLRCIYCMPLEGIPLMAHADILSYEEIRDAVDAAAGLGINKVRLTGGEPLVRSDLSKLVQMLATIKGIDDISLTTNGTLLAGCAAALKSAGLDRVNISLDSLRPDRFRSITRLGNLTDTLAGIEAAKEAGLQPVKINTVVMAGINDDEITDFARKTIYEGWHVRFIEYMPVNGNNSAASLFLPASEIRRRLETLGELSPCRSSSGNGPARYFRLSGGEGTIGFITPVSEHFCSRCNRIRLSADGGLRPCLLDDEEIDLKRVLRSGKGAAQIKELIKEAIARKPQRHHLSADCVLQSRPFSQVGG